MKKNKLVLFSAILGMSLSMATGTIGAFADTVDNPGTVFLNDSENEVQMIPVRLHKKQFNSMPGTTINTGNEITEGAIGTAAGLNGVTFTAYNVTNAYYDNLEEQEDDDEGTAVDKALAHVQTLTPTETEGQVGEPVVTHKVGDDDGIADFNLPLFQQVDGEDRYAVYVFIEEAAENIESVAANLAVAFPIYNTDPEVEAGTLLETVHLYPKNVINKRSITVKKVATDNSAVAELNGTLFEVSRLVEEGDNTIEEFYLGYDLSTQSVIWGTETDTVKAVKFEIVNGSVTIEGLTSGTYTLKEVEDADGFEMTEQSQEITFSIDESGDIVTTDTDNVVEDGNTVGWPTDIVDLEHEAEENTIVVENRTLVDMTIEKIEQGTGNAISGAEFKIAKEIPDPEKSDGNNYLYKKSNPEPGEYDYKWASEFGTGEKTGYEEVVLDGYTTKEVTGLLAGTYYVHEVTPPKGFILPEGEAAYTAIKLYTGTAAEKNRVGIDLSKDIENLRQGALPSTGGSGIVIFLTMGSALMGGAIIMHRRNRKEAEEI